MGRLTRDRKKWFHKMEGPYYALWWIASGHIPTVAEGKARLEHLARHGATAQAFWFGRSFPPDEPAVAPVLHNSD